MGETSETDRQERKMLKEMHVLMKNFSSDFGTKRKVLEDGSDESPTKAEVRGRVDLDPVEAKREDCGTFHNLQTHDQLPGSGSTSN